jgi:hypothetical protein
MQKIMNFSSAIREIIVGKKLTKLEWNNKDIYIFLKDAQLKIKLGDGSIVSLIVSEGDMVGSDWVVIDEPEAVQFSTGASPSKSPTSLVVLPPAEDGYDHNLSGIPIREDDSK